MNELEPLFDVSPSARMRALLQAGRREAAPSDFSERLLAGLGVAGVVTSVSVAASASASGAAASGAASTSSGAASAVLAVSKWVAVGVLGGGIFAGGVDLALSPQPALPVASPARPQSERSAPATALRPAVAFSASQPAPAISVEAPLRPDAASASAPAAAAAGHPGQLGREVQIIDRARQALSANDAARALKELDAFERSEQTGVLEREARVLRIDALLAQGQASRARLLAEQYLQLYPNDAHAARLRGLLRDAPQH
jgi:hypothetical protein